MTNSVYQEDFPTLRRAYLEIKNFIEKETSCKVLSLKTHIHNDLGCTGDDNYELLEKFVTKYKLNTSGFDYSKHFLSEGELFGSIAVLLQIITIPIFVVIWLLRVITFGKIDLTKKQFLPKMNRQTLDMSFGDILTWYLTGKYCLRSDVKFKLKKLRD